MSEFCCSVLCQTPGRGAGRIKLFQLSMSSWSWRLNQVCTLKVLAADSCMVSCGKVVWSDINCPPLLQVFVFGKRVKVELNLEELYTVGHSSGGLYCCAPVCVFLDVLSLWHNAAQTSKQKHIKRQKVANRCSLGPFSIYHMTSVTVPA